MKKQITIILTAFLIASLFVPQQIKAQSPPQKMSYQAVIRDGSNALITSTTVGMQISILQGSAMGGSTAVYVETQTPTSNINGLVSLEVGAGTVISGTFSAIDWANGSFYIKTETDPLGGTTYSITGTSQLLSVPYAFYAKTAGNGLTSGTAPGQMQYWNGTAWVTVASGITGQTLTFCNGVPVWGSCLSIGDSYQGGIIVYILQPGDPSYVANIQHGFIAAPSDQSAGADWGCSGVFSSAQNNALGSGNQNTTSIINNCSSTTNAAKLCDNLVIGSYSDWYLPSKDELNLLYINRIAIGGFTTNRYWSSSENGNNNAYSQDFSDGSQSGGWAKLSLMSVRAMRSF